MINDLIPIYGEAFLRYVLAVEDAPFDGFSLNDDQREITEVLRNLAFGFAPDKAQFDQYSRLSSLGQWHQDELTSLPNTFRLHCGGALPVLSGSDDPLIAALEIIARDAWPSLLIPVPKEGAPTFWSSIPLVALDHPQTTVAANAFLADEDLHRLYPHAPTDTEIDRDRALGLSSYWLTGLGGMAHHELLPLIGLLITNARLWGLVERGEDNFEALIKALPKVVTAVRSLASGETADVPYLAGFRGVELDSDVEIELSSGLLRSPREIDRSFLLPQADDVTAVLIGSYPLRLRGIEPKLSDGEIPDFSQHWRDLKSDQLRSERVLDLVRLSVLVASPPGDAWGLSQISSLIVDPTAAGGSPRRVSYEENSRSAKIDCAGAKRVASWWPRLRDELPGSLEIAMRRALSAAARRVDPVDGFVDSVIAWENCFGTEQETTFRVTGALAALLEPDALEKRLSLLKQLKDLYGKRSRVVHGAIHLSSEEAYTLRDDTLQIAIRCLRDLFNTRPELLEMDSAQRSTKLMLGQMSGPSR
jgi:hypothetical protein